MPLVAFVVVIFYVIKLTLQLSALEHGPRVPVRPSSKSFPPSFNNVSTSVSSSISVESSLYWMSDECNTVAFCNNVYSIDMSGLVDGFTVVNDTLDSWTSDKNEFALATDVFSPNSMFLSIVHPANASSAIEIRLLCLGPDIDVRPSIPLKALDANVVVYDEYLI